MSAKLSQSELRAALTSIETRKGAELARRRIEEHDEALQIEIEQLVGERDHWRREAERHVEAAAAPFAARTRDVQLGRETS